jgi:hypothetical protein
MACINEKWDSAGRHLVEDACDVAAIALASNTGTPTPIYTLPDPVV